MLDSSADARLLKQLAWALLASALAGAVVVSAGGAWLVRRALLPVRDLARQAAALSPDRVGQPLDGSAQAQELQPLVAQFNALLVRLNDAYQQLEGFNANVAHELRTPLATLIGETELALSREREYRRTARCARIEPRGSSPSGGSGQ
jgi:two-component system heavy metal sensor histidine kinase CusS